MDRVCSHLVSCRVSVEKPQSHQKSGSSFRVQVDVTVPRDHELVTVRNSGEGDLHQRLPTVVRQAFDATQRQVKKLTERQRGKVKSHPEQALGGFVIDCFAMEATDSSIVSTVAKFISQEQFASSRV